MTDQQIVILISFLSFITTIALVITTIRYTYLTGRLVKSEYGPKLYVYAETLDSSHEIHKPLMCSLGFKEFEPVGEGFVYRGTNKYKLVLNIVNNGKAPATDIQITYRITAFKNLIEFGIDRADIINYKPIIFKEVKAFLNKDYLPPGITEKVNIFYISTFPEVKLEIELLKCKEDKFIEKLTQISYYINPEFEKLEDSPHLKRLLGLL